MISPITYYVSSEVINLIKAIAVVATISTTVIMSIISVLYIVLNIALVHNRAIRILHICQTNTEDLIITDDEQRINLKSSRTEILLGIISRFVP